MQHRGKEGLYPTIGRLKGFTMHNLWTLGTIHLPITLNSSDEHKRRMALIDFFARRNSEKHNFILGRMTLFRFGAIPSTVHGILNFCIMDGLGIVLDTPPKTLQCHLIMMSLDITRDTKR